MITFNTRSRPYHFTKICTALRGLKTTAVLDQIISAVIPVPGGTDTVFPNAGETPDDFRQRLIAKLEGLLKPHAVDAPIQVSCTTSTLVHTKYKRRITQATLQALVCKEYKLPDTTEFMWNSDIEFDDPEVSVEAYYTLVSTASSSP